MESSFRAGRGAYHAYSYVLLNDNGCKAKLSAMYLGGRASRPTQ